MAGLKKKYEGLSKYKKGGKISDYALDALLYGANYMLSPLSVPVAMATGKSVPDLLGYEAKTEIGRKANQIIPKAQQLVGGAVVGKFTGANMSGLGGVTVDPTQKNQPNIEETPINQPSPTNTQETTETVQQTQKQTELPKNIYQQQDAMYKFKSGGLNQYRTINIEKGELLVNPKTLEILDNYNDAPKHPEGKHEIDLRGNREVPVGMAIIPAKYAEEFKKATTERKKEIINSLPGFNGNPKAAEGMYDSLGNPINLGTNVGAFGTTDTFSGYNPNSPGVEQVYITNTNPYVSPTVDQVYNTVPQQQQAPQGGGGGMGGIAPLVAAGTQLGFGLYQTIAANKALKKLGKEPYAMYNEQVQPELQSSYGAAQGRAADAALRSRYGLSQAQQAMYNQNVARDINTRMQRAQDIGGGNVGATVGTIMNANKIQAAQQQAALDAQLQMQKQQYADRAAQYAEGLAQRIAMARQGQQNQNTAFQQQLRLQKERAYGLAKQQGMQNMMNAPASYAAMQSSGSGGMNASQLMQLAQLGLI